MVLVALRRIIRAIDLRSHDLAHRYGLTGPQLALLKELSFHDGVSVGQLSRAIHLSQATVTGILDRLEKQDFIQRQQSRQDKRCVEVWLTKAGRQKLADAPPLLQEEFTEEFHKLDDWEQSQILSSLQRVVSMMEAIHIDATTILTTGPVAATPEETKAFLPEQMECRSGKVAGDGPVESVKAR